MKKDTKDKKHLQNNNVKTAENKTGKSKARQFEIKDIHVVVFFGLITFLFFMEIILQQKFFWEDFIYQYYPFRNFAAVSLSQGVLPFWNPYTFGGMPFLADIQTAFFYPLHLLLTVFVQENQLHFAYLEYLLIFHYFMAGVFSYYMARSLDLNKWASILCGITFMFCGFMVTHAIHETMIIQFTYMPLIFMFYNKSLNTCELKYTFLTGLFMGIAILCGHPQISLYTFFTLLLFGLYQMFFKFKENGYKINLFIVRFSAIVAVPFILGIMIGAVQLLPTMKLSELSIRSEMSYEESLDGSLNYRSLITLFSPKFFGTFNAEKSGIEYWGHVGGRTKSYLYWESCVYIGLSALVFGILAIFALWKQRIIKFLAVMSVFSILFILGDNFILYKLFYSFVPGFNVFRGIGRFGLVFAFSFSILGAYGFDYFMNNPDSEKIKKFIKSFIVLIALFFMVFVLYQAGFFKGIAAAYDNSEVYDNSTIQLLKTVVILSALFSLVILFKKKIITQKVCLFLFIVITVTDLYVFGSQHNTSPGNIGEFYQNRPAVDIIHREYQQDLFRIISRSKENLFVFDQNKGMVDFLFMLDGYNPLNLKNRFPPRRVNDLMNVRYFAVVHPETRKLRLDVNETCLPRVWMSYYPIIESSLEGISKILEDPTLDVQQKVIIDKEPEISIDTNLWGLGSNLVYLTDYAINEITLNVETNQNGILVLSEVSYPNWKVFVDGAEKPMLRCYHALRGVALEEGKHTVVFKYIDRDFQLGAIITLFALAIIIGGFAVVRYKTVQRAE